MMVKVFLQLQENRHGMSSFHSGLYVPVWATTLLHGSSSGRQSGLAADALCFVQVHPTRV